MLGKSILVAAGLSFLAVAALAAEQPPDQESLKIANEWNDAFSKANSSKDANGIAALFTENGFHVRPDGVRSGRETIRNLYAEDMKTFSEDPSKVLYARRAPDGSIIAVGTWSGTNKEPDGDKRYQGYWIDTLIKDGGTWRSTHEIVIDAQP